MTTDNELQEQTPEPRPVEELLKLDSFQGMTDAEIESVIKVRTEYAINDAIAKQAADTRDAILAAYRRGIALNRNAIQDLRAQMGMPELIEVNYEQAQ